MTQTLTDRFDISLATVSAIAWDQKKLKISAQAREQIVARRASFERLITSAEGVKIYGINVGQGEMAVNRMTQKEIDELARMKPLAAAVPFGEPYPNRVTRTIILARLANLIEGHGGGTLRLIDELVNLLNQGPIPPLSQSGHGGPGEILALYSLFSPLSQTMDLEPGERGALINGAPCAAALLADAALTAQTRMKLVNQVLALTIDAFNAPLEHYRSDLGALWGGSHNQTAFEALSSLLSGPRDVEERDHQAPVSYRIIPAVLGQAYWALAQAKEQAEYALSSITHNPTYLANSGSHPDGECFSTGGFHNAMAAPMMDNLAAIWADLCLLCERLSVGLLNGRVTGFPDFLLSNRGAGQTDGHGAVGYLPMAIVGFMEEARTAAQRTFIPTSDVSVFGQDNVGTPAFLAWPKQERAGHCLESSLAILAVTASQALHITGRQKVAPALKELLNVVRSHVPPITSDRMLGSELEALTNKFRTDIYPLN